MMWQSKMKQDIVLEDGTLRVDGTQPATEEKKGEVIALLLMKQHDLSQKEV